MKIEQRMKQAVRRTIGEVYVNKRLKMHNIDRELDRLQLDPRAVLDAGSEDATFVYRLADRYPAATVAATDINAEAIAACLAARPRRYASRVNFTAGTFADLPSGAFDLVTAFDVLEHITDDEGSVRDLARALRPGGHLLVHVPRNRWTHLDGSVEVVPDAEAWRINEGHVRMGYSPEGLSALLEGAGLRVLGTQLWLRRYGVRAHQFYTRMEHPTPLRLVTVPVTDVCTRLDRRRPEAEGNTVWAVARKP